MGRSSSQSSGSGLLGCISPRTATLAIAILGIILHLNTYSWLGALSSTLPDVPQRASAPPPPPASAAFVPSPDRFANSAAKDVLSQLESYAHAPPAGEDATNKNVYLPEWIAEAKAYLKAQGLSYVPNQGPAAAPDAAANPPASSGKSAEAIAPPPGRPFEAADAAVNYQIMDEGAEDAERMQWDALRLVIALALSPLCAAFLPRLSALHTLALRTRPRVHLPVGARAPLRRVRLRRASGLVLALQDRQGPCCGQCGRSGDPGQRRRRQQWRGCRRRCGAGWDRRLVRMGDAAGRRLCLGELRGELPHNARAAAARLWACFHRGAAAVLLPRTALLRHAPPHQSAPLRIRHLLSIARVRDINAHVAAAARRAAQRAQVEGLEAARLIARVLTPVVLGPAVLAPGFTLTVFLSCLSPCHFCFLISMYTTSASLCNCTPLSLWHQSPGHARRYGRCAQREIFSVLDWLRTSSG
ncbi:hypothetical protein L1887_42633 [Cichorium endivia]|nr:hypothetical protein L1887_42633 [Cichorium endivia]